MPAADKDALIAQSPKLVRDYFVAPTGLDIFDRRFDAVAAWGRTHGIPNGRIILGEFGGLRRISGNDAVTGDLLK